MTHSTVIGFDFGLKKIGIAVGQTVTQSANPQAILTAQNGVPDWRKVAQLIKEWSAKALIVGLPWNMDGTGQNISVLAQQFSDSLKQKFDLPVYLVDERLTTKTARSQLAEKGKLTKTVVDSYAAKLILEDWLRSQG